MSIDQQIEPIDRLLDKRAPFKPNTTPIFAAAQCLLDDVSDTCQCGHRRLVAKMMGAIREEIPPENFRRNVSFATIISFTRAASFGIATGRQGSIKIEVGLHREQASKPFIRDA